MLLSSTGLTIRGTVLRALVRFPYCLVKRVGQAKFQRAGASDFTAYAYSQRGRLGGASRAGQGRPGGRAGVARVHRGCLLAGDVLGSAAGEAAPARAAICARDRRGPRGARLPAGSRRGRARLRCTHGSNEEVVPGVTRSDPAARVRRRSAISPTSGSRRLKLLTNHPKQIVGLESYGLEVRRADRDCRGSQPRRIGAQAENSGPSPPD